MDLSLLTIFRDKQLRAKAQRGNSGKFRFFQLEKFQKNLQVTIKEKLSSVFQCVVQFIITKIIQPSTSFPTGPSTSKLHIIADIDQWDIFMLRHWIACIMLLTNPPGLKHHESERRERTRENLPYQILFISNLNSIWRNHSLAVPSSSQTKSLLWNQKNEYEEQTRDSSTWVLLLRLHTLGILFGFSCHLMTNFFGSKRLEFREAFHSWFTRRFVPHSHGLIYHGAVAFEKEGVDFVELLNGDIFKCSAPSELAQCVPNPGLKANHIIMIFSFAFCLHELNFLCIVRSREHSLWKNFADVFWTFLIVEKFFLFHDSVVVHLMSIKDYPNEKTFGCAFSILTSLAFSLLAVETCFCFRVSANREIAMMFVRNFANLVKKVLKSNSIQANT